MKRIFLLLFCVIMAVDIFAVIDATKGLQALQQKDGVRVERQATSATKYSYLLLTNDNNYAVAVTYEVGGKHAGLVYLNVTETKRSHTAYLDTLKVDIKVMRDNRVLKGQEQHNRTKRDGRR